MSRDPAKLDVYRRAHELVLAIYRLTAELPSEERYGLRAQLRRAALSVPANIGEGAVYHSAAEYARFLAMALGSAVETRYLLPVIGDLELLPLSRLAPCHESSDHLVRALQKLHRAVRAFPRSDE